MPTVPKIDSPDPTCKTAGESGLTSSRGPKAVANNWNLLGPAVRKRMKELDLHDEDVARMAGVSIYLVRQLCGNYRRGDDAYTDEEVQFLCCTLGWSRDSFERVLHGKTPKESARGKTNRESGWYKQLAAKYHPKPSVIDVTGLDPTIVFALQNFVSQLRQAASPQNP